MHKGTLGVLTGLAVWCGAALSAEAQVIGVDITGPLSVHSGLTSFQIHATAARGSIFWESRVLVNGLLRNCSGYKWATTTSIVHYVWNVNTWSLVPGDTMEIQMRTWLGSYPSTPQDTVTLTVQSPPGGQTLKPAEKLNPIVPAYRDEALAWLNRKDFEVMA
jgi:hypothetical protein